MCNFLSSNIDLAWVEYESKKEPEIERNHQRLEFPNLTIDNAQLGQGCVLPQSVKEVAELDILHSEFNVKDTCEISVSVSVSVSM